MLKGTMGKTKYMKQIKTDRKQKEEDKTVKR